MPASKELGAKEFELEENGIRDEDDYFDEALYIRARDNGSTVMHPSGTCAMASVVDSECRVYGVKGLRVVDASVFPMPLSTHYQAPVYAVAEQVGTHDAISKMSLVGRTLRAHLLTWGPNDNCRLRI